MRAGHLTMLLTVLAIWSRKLWMGVAADVLARKNPKRMARIVYPIFIDLFLMKTTSRMPNRTTAEMEKVVTGPYFLDRA
jgi:hypothetical protein